LHCKTVSLAALYRFTVDGKCRPSSKNHGPCTAKRYRWWRYIGLLSTANADRALKTMALALQNGIAGGAISV
jgi:predicted secreted hydrolase